MRSTPARKARLKRGARRLGLGAAAVMGVAAVVMLLAVRSDDTAAPLNPDLVAVATLANETGDPALAPLGRLAAERIAQGMQQYGVADVVPPAVALAAAEEVRQARDPALALAATTGAGVVVHGAYYVLGDSLQFQIQFTDAADRRLMTALEPVAVLSEPATEALDLVRERVLGALAAALDFRSGAEWLPVQPPSLEAYRLLRGETADGWRQHVQDLRTAWAMDSTFYPALVLLAGYLQAMGMRGGGDTLLAEADSLFQVAEGYSDRMSEVYRLAMEGFHQYRRGVDPETRLRRARRLTELTPWFFFQAGMAAWQAHRPREALELLARVDTANPNAAQAMPRWWSTRGGALHMLGRYEEAVRLHDRHELFTELPEALRLERIAIGIGPLASVGRFDEIAALVDSIFAMAPLRPTAFGTPPAAAEFAAAELRAHGYPDSARSVLRRTLEWLEARPADEVRELATHYRYTTAGCLYKLERWEEAGAVYGELLAEFPEDTVALAGMGRVAARLGNAARARAISAQLADVPGGQPLGRAHIAALLGEREEAVRLLREALWQDGTTGSPRSWGWHMMQRHVDMDLEPLHGYPPFELFMRPRG